MNATMLCLVDGEPQERLVDFVEQLEGQQQRAWPVLNEGEEVVWIVGDARPWIVRTVP